MPGPVHKVERAPEGPMCRPVRRARHCLHGIPSLWLPTYYRAMAQSTKLDDGCACAGSSAMDSDDDGFDDGFDDGWEALLVEEPRIVSDARRGDLEAVKQWVGQQSDLLNVADSDGETPLMAASQGGHVEIVQWLLDQGAAIDHQSHSGTTALSFASSKGRASVVRLLLERAADPTIANAQGLTPLMAACDSDLVDLECIAALEVSCLLPV
jgi:hypothetical protein